MRPLFLRPPQTFPSPNRFGGPRSRFPQPSGNGFGSNNLPKSNGPKSSGGRDQLNQTWNVKPPPGNPNGNPKIPNNPGFNWGKAFWRAGKEAFWEMFRPEPLPDVPDYLVGPNFSKWVREENERRGYPSPNRFPNYEEYGPPKPQKPKVVKPSDDPDWPEPQRFPETPPDSPRVPSQPTGDWPTNLPPGSYQVEMSLDVTWYQYGYDTYLVPPRPPFEYTGSFTNYQSATVVNPISVGVEGNDFSKYWYIFASVVDFAGYPEQSPHPNGEPQKFYIPGSQQWIRGGKNYHDHIIEAPYSGFSSNTVALTATFISEKPIEEPLRNKQNTNNTKTEDNMSCPPCQARQMLRELSQTITVESVTLTKIPTGDLLATSVQVPKRVFALPGTQDAVKDQFNLFAELKKRTAQAFNQARKAKVLAKLQQLMSVTDFVLNLHNALMLSEDIAQTFFGTISGTVDVLIKLVDDTPFIGDLFDLGETPINSGEFFGKALEDKLKAVFGAPTWEAIKVKWAAVNNIVRNAAMQIQAARDIADAQRDLSEMTASRVGKLHNKLAKAGLLGDTDLWEEKVNRRWAWMYKLEDMASDNRFTNSAQFIQSWAGQVIDIREQQKDMETSREKFKTDLKADFDKITGEKAKTVIDSAGAPYARSDSNPPAEDDPQ